MNLKVIIVLTVIIKIIYAQVPSLHKCPNLTVVDNFNTTKYMGKWYEAKRYFIIFELAAKCVTAVYEPNYDGTISVINSQINSITNLPSSIKGYARSASTSHIAKLFVTFAVAPVDGSYWVLGTDYENYSVVWSCTQLGLISFRNVWILTRAKKASHEVLTAANKVLTARNISTKSWFINTDQEHCPDDY